jgi:hypothetical protein
LTGDPAVVPGITGQLLPHEGDAAVAVNLNNSFLKLLGGGPESDAARDYLENGNFGPAWAEAAGFYLSAANHVEREIRDRTITDPDFTESMKNLSDRMNTGHGMSDPAILEKLRHVFFPEGAGILDDPERAVVELREKRSVTLHSVNPNPVVSPHLEILFTANVLLTIPLDKDPDQPGLSHRVKGGLERACRQQQTYWYDHPIPIGVPLEKNEAVYGLRGLEDAIRFEIRRGTVPPEVRVPVLLSVSTTHEALQDIARPYLETEIPKAGGASHLDLYAVTERDTRDLLDEVLLPAVEKYLPGSEAESLTLIFGVDGEYGRHYSFLKAIAALWQCLLDGRFKATFKIDLDQVFPQEILVSETGLSAFEHLSNPLWGAEGTDVDGNPVRFGMLAGALVNEADIGNGLFTPDVKWPPPVPNSDSWIFYSSLPQALSSEAEMITRYGDGRLDGRKTCLQRIHVTGGTTGILIEDLRRYRPFTPTWIGRAEDQAYLMSVLFPEEGPALRYAHASGLFMRHDKEAFASEAIRAAHVGKIAGDYVRILDFTSYARILPWEFDDIKSVIDPFTGCFVSRIPVTVSALRLAFRSATFLSETALGEPSKGVELVRTGCSRLAEAIVSFSDEDALENRFRRERYGWDLYYDLLDVLERNLLKRDPDAVRFRERAVRLRDRWHIAVS